MNSLRGSVTNRQLMQRFLRRLQSSKLRSNSTATTNASSSSNAEPEIYIPIRKERSATDILLALEKTISRDPTAAHYKYHDDPFLIPQSNRAKRSYALSKEAGRKAAMWIHQEHANLFPRDLSEPEIKAFMPKTEYKTKEEVSENLLLNAIKEGSVTDALTFYQLLEKEISVESKQALLELLCYYNSQDQLPGDLIEERWYRKAANRQRQTWKDSAEVEELFGFLKTQEMPIAVAAYNTMICGTAKYMKVDRSWALFEECEEKNIPLSLMTYNYIIRLVPILRDGPSERRALLRELLTKIDRAGLRPDIGTLNSALRVASLINITNIAKDLTKSIFVEFRKLGVEPSLASYYFVLITFCKDHGPKSTVLREIIDELAGKCFTMQDPSDTNFFVTAMDVARNHLGDREVANKIHKLLLTGNNYNLIGEGFKESIYYRHYMGLLLKTLPFDEFMKFYDSMVPNIYIPEPGIMREIIDAVEMNDPTNVRDVLARLWSHMLMFEHLEREELMTKTFALMRTHCQPDVDSPTNQQYAEAAWNYWNYVKDQNAQRVQRIQWHGKVMADLAILSMRGDKYDRFLEIIATMAINQNSIIGIADIEQLNIIFEACLKQGYAGGTLDILQYSVEAGFEDSGAMARKIETTIPLTREQHAQLVKIIGTEVLKTKSAENEEIEK